MAQPKRGRPQVPSATAVGVWLRSVRAQRGLTQAQLADRTGGYADQSDISRLERGKTSDPGIMMILALSRALRLNIGDLVPLAGMMAPQTAVRAQARAALKEIPAQPLPADLGRYLHKIEEQVEAIGGVAQKALSLAKGKAHDVARPARAGGRRRR